MTGHIKLGKFADASLRDYSLVDPQNWQSASANPFVARVSTGGVYNELDTFNDQTWADWHMGVGNVDPEQGQAFSHAMTLYPNYLLPPLRLSAVLTDYTHGTNVNDSDLETDDYIPYSTHWYSTSITPAENMTLGYIGIYMYCPTGNKINIRLYSDSADKPGMLLASKTNVTSSMEGVYAHWFMVDFGSTVSLTGSTIYHIAVSTDVASMPASGVPPHIPPVWLSTEVSNVSTDNGATWTETDDANRGFLTFVTVASTDTIKGIYCNDNGTYVWKGNTVGKITSGALTTIFTETTIYDVKLYGNDLYVAYGTGYHRYATGTATDTNVTSTTCYMLLAYAGYIWRSLGTTLAYSNDETAWVILPNWAIDTTDTITGLAGMGEDVYFATRTGLWMVALGDQILNVLPWSDAYSTNGTGMVSWENALYIPMGNGTIFRYDSSGGFLNISPNIKREFPIEMARGTIAKLYPSNFFLLVAYSYGYPGEYPSLWAYNVDGWHCLSVGPREHASGGLGIDISTERLYWGFSKGLLLSTLWPGAVVNPVFSTELYHWARDGWVEYDKFYAGHRRLDKDFSDLLLDGDQNVADCQVYWQDETHTTWQSGATWGDASVTRPVGEWVKVGVRLITKGGSNEDPAILRAITLKYTTNIADRWRWTLPLEVCDNQIMLDGSVNPYTGAQIKAHLDELIAETLPLQFADIDGAEYYAKVTGASRNVIDFRWNSGTEEAEIKYVYTVTLEEV
jgi:hypothetical protein